MTPRQYLASSSPPGYADAIFVNHIVILWPTTAPSVASGAIVYRDIDANAVLRDSV